MHYNYAAWHLISTTILNSDKEISLDSHIIAIVSNQGTRFSKTQL